MTSGPGFIGQVGPFEAEVETFECYTERLEQYFEVNGITGAKRKSTLLSVIGAQAYGTLRDLLSPHKPATRRYDELIETLKSHFNPSPLVIAERYKFWQRNQEDGESINLYIVCLRRLAGTCQFGQFLNEALRDRIVCGMKNDQCRRKLLCIAELTLEKTIEAAKAMELAEKNNNELSRPAKLKTNVDKLYASAHKVKERPNKSFYHRNNHSGAARKSQKCWRCGSEHWSRCKYENNKCYQCGKVGHLARVCTQKSTRKTGRVHEVTEDYESDTETFDLFGIYSCQSRDEPAPREEIVIENVPLQMEIDTGAVVTIVGETFYDKHLRHKCEIKPTSRVLRGYSGTKIDILGEVNVHVQHDNCDIYLPLMICRGNRTPLLGRNWMKYLNLDLGKIMNMLEVSSDSSPEISAQAIIRGHQKLLDNSLGKVVNYKATIRLKQEARPRLCKPRTVPYALQAAYDRELDRLVSEGVLEPIEFSEWGSPVVTVPKSDGSVRICGDYKVHVNSQIEEDVYGLPNVDDLLAKLGGGALFTKLDLSHAYQQIELDDKSQEVLTINTTRGLYKVKRLMYGVSSAPAIFQRTMDQVLQGIENILCYMDDILIKGETESQHNKTLQVVLSRLEQKGMRLKKAKLEVAKRSVTYLGFRIDKDGVHPTTGKMQAINEAPRPADISQLRSWLGLVNYYGSFLPNLSTKLEPLYRLLKAEEPFVWSDECEHAFKCCKAELQSDKVLAHYDLKKPLRLECDASPVGIGAVLSHVMEDGSQRPIAFVSKTLSSSEKNYAQIEREALGIIFGVKRFHKYLYGRRFTLVTNHKPLTTILGPKTGVPPLAAARMQRWSLLLSGYSYDIIYRKSEDNANADAMSRLPCKDKTSVESDIFRLDVCESMPVTAVNVAEATRKDPILSRVLDYVCMGWPSVNCDDNLKPYWSRQDELSVERGCILWGTRVVLPSSLRQSILDELHDNHPGVSRMKTYARGYVWWPGLDANIEELVSSCSVCLQQQHRPTVAPLHPWKWPTRVLQRVHIDYAEKDGKHFFILIDAHSKWVEVVYMAASTTSQRTIEVLRNWFAAYGLPEEIVSDNGPQFTSTEFADFLRKNGVKHTKVSPYHPASNGAAERTVQIFKRSIKAQEREATSIQHKIAKFLFNYRNTPQTTTKCTPAELFLKRQPRTRLTLLKPNLAETVEQKQQSQMNNKPSKLREFKLGGDVLVRNHRSDKTIKWIPGVVLKRLGPVSYVVKSGGSDRYVHVDNLVKGHKSLSMGDQSENVPIPLPDVPDTIPSGGSVPHQSQLESEDSMDSKDTQEPDTESERENVLVKPDCMKSAKRMRKPVVKMDL